MFGFRIKGITLETASSLYFDIRGNYTKKSDIRASTYMKKKIITEFMIYTNFFNFTKNMT